MNKPQIWQSTSTQKIYDMDDMFSLMQRNFKTTFNDWNSLNKKVLDKMQITQEQQSIKQSSLSRPKRKLEYGERSQQKIKSTQTTVHDNQSLKISAQNQSTLQNENIQSNISSPYNKIIVKTNNSKPIQLINDSTINSINQQLQNVQALSQQNIQFTSILDYRDLQQKIQSALKKNTKYKEFSSTSRMTKSNLTTQSFNQFNQTLLDRFDQYEKKKEKQILKKKHQLQQLQDRQLKFHPKINKKSQKFVQQMGGFRSIQNRYEKILQAKHVKIRQHEEKKKIKQQEQYAQFMDQFAKFQKSPQQNTRSSDQFYQEMITWKQRARKHVEQKKRIIKQKQLRQTNDFKPKINKKSEQILINSAKIQKRVPVHERQPPFQKQYKTKFDEQCTFKPKINKQRVK